MPRVARTRSTTNPSHIPDWRWRPNQFTSALDHLPHLQMSEVDDRKAKAARAKALVCIPIHKSKLPLVSDKPLKQLKKRQQATKSEKSPPPSRTFTPLPQDPPPADSPTTQADDTPNAADMHVSLSFETPQQRRTHVEFVFLKSRFGQTPEADGTWLNSLLRVDNAPASLPTIGGSGQDFPPPARLPHDGPATSSPTHSLLQSLRAELQRHQETIASLKSERDALGEELDRRRDVETSGLPLNICSSLST